MNHLLRGINVPLSRKFLISIAVAAGLSGIAFFGGLVLGLLPENGFVIAVFFVSIFLCGGSLLALGIKDGLSSKWYLFGAFGLSAIFGVVGYPFGYLSDFLIVLAAILLAAQLLGSDFLSFQGISDEKYKSKLLSVFESDEFLTTLRSTLPSGVKDEEHGLDYIPFMLHAAADRQKKHQKAANKYLVLLFSSATIFSLVVVALGYIIIANDSIGISRELRELSVEQSKLSENLGLLNTDLETSDTFNDCCIELTERLSSLDLEDIQTASRTLLVNPNFENFDLLRAVLGSSNRVEMGQESAQLVFEADRAFASFQAQYNRIPKAIENTVSSIEGMIDTASTLLNTPTSQTAETLKRVAIGLVVTTFFLAILRFISNLYRTEREAGMLAAAEEREARKFYICLRCTDNDPIMMAEVLKVFLSHGAKQSLGTESVLKGASVADINTSIENLSKLLKK